VGIDQHGAAPEQVTISLQDEVDGGVQQRMPGQTNSASGLPTGAISSFSKVMRSYRVSTGSVMCMRWARCRMGAGTWAIW
jgi:hypothetical protein